MGECWKQENGRRENNNGQSKNKNIVSLLLFSGRWYKCPPLVENYLVTGKSMLSANDIQSGYFKECYKLPLKIGPEREAWVFAGLGDKNHLNTCQ